MLLVVPVADVLFLRPLVPILPPLPLLRRLPLLRLVLLVVAVSCQLVLVFLVLLAPLPLLVVLHQPWVQVQQQRPPSRRQRLLLKTIAWLQSLSLNVPILHRIVQWQLLRQQRPLLQPRRRGQRPLVLRRLEKRCRSRLRDRL